MTQAVRRFGFWDWAVVGGGLMAVAVLELLQPRPFGMNIQTAPTRTAQEAFADWSATAEGGAAFAMGANGAYGWADNHHTAASAREFALAYCGRADCRVVEDRDDGVYQAQLDQVVSPRTARSFEKLLVRPGAKAFAINAHGFSGYYYGAKTQLGAKSGAVAACQKYKNGYPEGISEQPCVVVYSGW